MSVRFSAYGISWKQITATGAKEVMVRVSGQDVTLACGQKHSRPTIDRLIDELGCPLWPTF